MKASRLKNWVMAVFFVMTAGGAAGSMMAPTPAAAVCVDRFLTFPTWYRGVTDGNCEITMPSNDLSGFIWRIALNIVEIMLQLAGYVAVAFVIYGGFLFMISTGSPEGAAKARTTIFNALIGLVLSIASVAIVNLIAGAIM